MRARLVFVHGWAFGPGFWDGLRALLPEYESTALDLGFFGPEDTTSLSGGSSPLVAVGHSLGFQWLLGGSVRADALVSLAGFARFAVPPGPVRAMRRGLSRDPARVVHDFHAACGIEPGERLAPARRLAQVPDSLPGVAEGAGIDADRLAAGLDRLLTVDESVALVAWKGPLLSVAARDDLVVPEALSRTQFPSVVMLPEGGHAFPATRPAKCAVLLRPFLEGL